jgi:hydroxyacylglutathione hydrolase
MNSISNFSIRSILGGFDKNFTYLITCNQSRKQIIIDPSVDLKFISPFINDKPIAIFISHSHHDHIKYLEQYIESFPRVFVFGHSISADKFLHTNFKIINNNETIQIGKIQITGIHTPGHYFDSICYLIPPVIFTGDTMFVGRTGRVISSGSNIEELYNSIYNKILTLPNHTRIYPGHHYGNKKSISLKNNIKESPLLQASSLDDFLMRMVEYEKNRKENY